MLRNRTRPLALIALAAILAGVLATAVWAAGRYKIVIEAEHYNAVKPSTVAKTGDKTAGGAGYVEYPLRRPHATSENPAVKGDGGYALYKVKIPEAATYTIWVRTFWWDACGNSFFLIVDDKPAQTVGGDGTYQTWKWRKAPQAYALTAGTHIIKLQNREDGARADQLLITNDARTIPTRAEAETPQYRVTE
jgi:hypothetical protein